MNAGYIVTLLVLGFSAIKKHHYRNLASEFYFKIDLHVQF